ncbi:enoyl-CoA hydratase/isomerase family protein [Mycobacteroides abscessus]|uniref:enoyl-CoA hydratase/isomerase family protein n=1 Tax=Mycobacteroides abscessus TaxID=36809 RepID=UPI0005E37405|nr:enoyl-CoA hydratase-related protein [Mycobacteroides abscessus]CPR97024.1 enoyl-CoA hydratase [Mycobacteroides abscessus]CPS30353.1 enoyl-CoA hydratase [Mycobacteroides abscessus]CPS49484.1 enoyl-CoA hydratase [Mycobacteroides abscessus]CPT27584.1 enoyl-CoA hydratase [Mycobacteroides abscessus]CPT41193.1 enoyl-CoA hydratase [Mycobacteroides abscessus]
MNVITHDEDAVRTITLNRPTRRNAIDIPLRVELAEALEAAHAEQAVRAIVLTGAGSVFCSGGDISTMEVMEIQEASERAQMAQRVIRAIWTTPKPVIAAVEGAAFGAGTALAAACDRVVAASDARFAATFTNVGLAGDMGAYVSLPHRVGLARARQMLMLPEPVGATTALEWGLVDALAGPGEALAVAMKDAFRLVKGPARALGVIKTLLAAAPLLSPFDVLDQEAAYQATLFGSKDFAEGVAAFRERRSPGFGQRPGVPS